MECNKEEAIRAMAIAERKMQIKDFVGARKITLKAQQLFQGLENISQLLTVCDVHCSAGNKVNGEIDWYGILQVEPTADGATIKKQYRKLALLLHPDKNKFAGAEAAFKLIGEAHRTLSDRAKRHLYDLKQVTTFKTVPLRQPGQQSNCYRARKQSGVANNVTTNASSEFKGLSQQQQTPSADAKTFWTTCPSCDTKYKYYHTVINKLLSCQYCSKPFVAYELNAEAVPSKAISGHSWKHSGNSQQESATLGAHNVGQRSFVGAASASMGFQGNMCGDFEKVAKEKGENSGGSENKAKEQSKVAKEIGTGHEVKFEKVKLEDVNCKQMVKPSAGNASQKRARKTIVESVELESSDSDDVVIEKEGHSLRQNIQTLNSYYLRKSSRQKQNFLYNEDDNNDDNDNGSSSSKRLKKGGASCITDQKHNACSTGNASPINVQSSGIPVSEGKLPNGWHSREQGEGERGAVLEGGTSSKANAVADSSSMATPVLDTCSYPDPEFCNFETERNASNFAKNQIWAVYDAVDGMPRFYARIRRVFGPDFKLQFTWLEHDPVGEDEVKWSGEDLLVGCGNFRLGKSEYTQERNMFSHLMPWRKGMRRNSYKIYPRTGEVWALFKDWDIRWSSNADNRRHFDVEIVEILSDYTEGAHISVVPLAKVKGFVCLFVRAVDKERFPLQIPAHELLRFSHKVPSYRTTGEEREGIPEGSFELDSFSLPVNFEETSPSICLESINLSVGYKYASNREQFSTRPTKTNIIESNKNYVHDKDRWNRGFSSNGAKEAHGKVCNEASANEHTAEARKLDGIEENSDTNSSAQHHNPGQPAPTINFEFPDSEFHDFEQQRSTDKFQQGQIWALYSDIDKYPKYYYQITKVDLDDFKVQGRWLEACQVQGQMRWLEEDLPIGCGLFKILHEKVTFDTTDTFSHQVAQAKAISRRDQYEIYPSIGQVWALYKNLNVSWSFSDLENCEFILAEVLDHTCSGIKVLVLKKVDGYRGVFMPEKKGTAVTTIEIPVGEYLRFSHQIPAVRLTEERGGKLRGCWELDLASVPDVLYL